MLDMHIRPSEIMGLDDEYTAFCFDEACALIVKKIKDGEEPVMRIENEKVVYSRPSDVYNKYK